MSTSTWISFFSAAGIPTDVGATYAITFAENRIQQDMLLDLNKEYLRDMGISRMGDVIAILRHAKKYHENCAREKVLSISSTPKVPVAAVAGRITQDAKQTSPATRMLEHYTRNSGASPTSTSKIMLKRKIDRNQEEDDEIESTSHKKRQITFGPALPPNYTPNVIQKLNIFARLGNTNQSLEDQGESKTIFSRLGQKTVEREDLPKEPEGALEYEGILKSTSSFKTIKITQIPSVKKKTVVGTMRADEAPVSIKEKLARVKSVKFSNKVEYKEIDPLPKEKFVRQKQAPIFNKPERRLLLPKVADKPPKDDSGIKARLGKQEQVKKVSLNRSSVFSRLGS